LRTEFNAEQHEYAHQPNASAQIKVEKTAVATQEKNPPYGSD